MKSVVYFFTRTGVSKKIAKEVAAKYGAEVYKIADNKNWNGFTGFIKAGYSSVKKKSIPAIYREPQNGEQIILVMPLWAGGFPPAVRTFIDSVGRSKINLVVTSKGSTLVDRDGFAKVVDLVGNDANAWKV